MSCHSLSRYLHCFAFRFPDHPARTGSVFPGAGDLGLPPRGL